MTYVTRHVAVSGHVALANKACHVLQAKVKAVADLVWSKLTGAFTKDLHHAQVPAVPYLRASLCK